MLFFPWFYRDFPRYAEDAAKYQGASFSIVYWKHFVEQKSIVAYSGHPSEAALYDEVERMQDWMPLFSNTGVAYPSLRKMLAKRLNVPRNVLLGMQYVHFDTAIKNRTRLIMYMRAATMDSLYGGKVYTKIVERSSDEQLRKALSMAARYTHDKDDMRSVKRIERLFHILCDYRVDATFKGTIIAYAEQSLLWHRAEAERAEQARLSALTKDKENLHVKTLLPPIGLPDNGRVRFLDTVGAVYEEGAHMRHCIGSYASRAVKGHSYLFHVDYAGEEASVEVSPSGRVLQAHGPHNSTNKACLYGQRVLSTWGKPLREVNPKQAEIGQLII